MNELEFYLPYLGITVLSCFLLFLAGSFISGIFQETALASSSPINKWKVLFRNLLTGVAFFAVAMAIFSTRGNTIFILTIPLAGAYLYFNKLKLRIGGGFTRVIRESRLCLSPELLLLIGFALYLGYITFSKIFFEGFGLYSPAGDINFYSRASSFISFSGKESFYLSQQVKGATPYHYFELWFNGLLKNISGTKSYFAFVLSTIPILSAILLAGICSLLTRLNFLTAARWPMLILALALAMINFKGFYIPVLASIHPVFQSLTTFQLPVTFPKVMPAVLLVIAAVINYLDGKKATSLLIFMFIPCATIATAPGIFGGTFLFLLYLALIKKQKQAFSYLVFFTGYMVLFGLFYIINSKLNTADGFSKVTSSMSAGAMLGNFTDPTYIRTWINILVGTTGTLPFLFLPVIVLLAFRFSGLRNFTRQYQDLLVLYLCLNAVALATWATIHRVLDSTQLFQIIFLPTTFVMVIVIIASVFNDIQAHSANRPVTLAQKAFIVLVVCSPLVLSALPGQSETGVPKTEIPYSYEYLEKVRSYFEAKPATEIAEGAILNEVASKTTMYAKNLNIQWPGATYLPTFTNQVYLTSLNIMDISRAQDPNTKDYQVEDMYISSAPFYQFCVKQNLADTYPANKIAAKLAYIAAHPELDFVIVDRDFRDIIGHLKYKALYTDPVSQQAFVVLQ